MFTEIVKHLIITRLGLPAFNFLSRVMPERQEPYTYEQVEQMWEMFHFNQPFYFEQRPWT